jgi:hydrogenase maturation factor HypF (carbamoyltransferase family)
MIPSCALRAAVTRQLRRSRGFVPVPVFLKDEQPSVLAVGGELKNTICLTKGKHAFLSQHVGDLENVESYSFFHEAIEHLERILEIRPEIIAYDLHPDYFSTQMGARNRPERSSSASSTTTRTLQVVWRRTTSKAE